MNTVIGSSILIVSSLNDKDRTGLGSNGFISGGHSVSFIVSLNLITDITDEGTTSGSISHHDMVSHLEVTGFTEGKGSLNKRKTLSETYSTGQITTYRSVRLRELRLSLVNSKHITVLLCHVVLDLGLTGLFVFVPVSNASFGVELRAT